MAFVTLLLAEQAPPTWTEVVTTWATVATAIATVFLFGGVIFAAAQYVLTRHATRVVETGKLIKEWNRNKLWEQRSLLDDSPDEESNRRLATRFYRFVMRFKDKKRYRKTARQFNDFIEDHARLAERMEIYLRRNVADENILMDHLRYDILHTYFALQDILAVRAREENLDYERFLHLVQRAQDYSKLHKQFAPDDKLVYYEFPPLVFMYGVTTDSHPQTLWRRIRLALKETYGRQPEP